VKSRCLVEIDLCIYPKSGGDPSTWKFQRDCEGGGLDLVRDEPIEVTIPVVCYRLGSERMIHFVQDDLAGKVCVCLQKNPRDIAEYCNAIGTWGALAVFGACHPSTTTTSVPFFSLPDELLSDIKKVVRTTVIFRLVPDHSQEVKNPKASPSQPPSQKLELEGALNSSQYQSEEKGQDLAQGEANPVGELARQEHPALGGGVGQSTASATETKRYQFIPCYGTDDSVEKMKSWLERHHLPQSLVHAVIALGGRDIDDVVMLFEHDMIENLLPLDKYKLTKAIQEHRSQE